MTVAELIKQLRKYNQDLEVFYKDENENCYSIKLVDYSNHINSGGVDGIVLEVNS